MTAWVDELRDVLAPGELSVDLALRLAASQDYAWLSPILTAALPAEPADAVVTPRSVDAVPAVLQVAHHHGVPVTVRGRGTGNYGQAVPLQRGIVIDMSVCDTVRGIDGNIADVAAGVTFTRLEQAAAAHGLEVAVMPSMVGSTVGGFLSGGNQGIGSIEHGSIWDGWVRGLDVAGCRADASVVVVDGEAVRAHLHTYGTGGVITGSRLRLAPRRERTVVFASFDDFRPAAEAGRSLMDLDPVPRVVAVDDPQIVAVLPAHAGVVTGMVMLRAAVEVGTVEQVGRIVTGHGGTVTAVDRAAMSALFASIYNHATLRAKRAHPDACSVQVRGSALVEHGDEVRAALPDACLHLDGNAPAAHGKGYSGLLLSRWVDEATLEQGMARLRDLGVIVISPHTWVLGGHGNVDRIRAITPTFDPAGLLNPGKLPAA